MRTDEQITNLRHVMVAVMGIGALFLSREDVDVWADRIQKQVNHIPEDPHWEVRVRTDENDQLRWHEIEKEPTNPQASLEDIYEKCKNLLIKYPKIKGIQLICVEHPTWKYIVGSNTRKK